MPAEGSTFDKYQSVHSKIFAQSLIVEFFGTLCFQFLGGTVSNPFLGPFVNGFALAVLVYLAANISGGHLNPAVTFSTFICGFYPALHSVLYITVQILGCMTGAAIAGGLVPGTTFGSGTGPGCFDDETVSGLKDLSNAQIFGWECMMTFVLIGAVYSCGVAKPGHGSFTPLVVGLSLLACAGTGGSQTGAALNPARVLGPAAVYGCSQFAWIYVLAQFCAAVCACLLFVTVSGWGPLFPFESRRLLGLTHAQAVHMWLTGSPAKQFRESAGDTIGDVLYNSDVHNVGAIGASPSLKRLAAVASQRGTHAATRAARQDDTRNADNSKPDNDAV